MVVVVVVVVVVAVAVAVAVAVELELEVAMMQKKQQNPPVHCLSLFWKKISQGKHFNPFYVSSVHQCLQHMSVVKNFPMELVSLRVKMKKYVGKLFVLCVVTQTQHHQLQRNTMDYLVFYSSSMRSSHNK